MPENTTGSATSILRTKRLVLRRATLADVDAFHEIMSDPRAMRYWSRPAHDDIADTRRFVEFMAGSPTNGSDDFVIEMDGRVVGKAGAWAPPEVGFILRPDHWRRGIVTEAMETLIPYLFATHAVPLLTAEIDPRNVASEALLRKLGFSEAGRAQRTMQWGDEWCDSVCFALPRPAGH